MHQSMILIGFNLRGKVLDMKHCIKRIYQRGYSLLLVLLTLNGIVKYKFFQFEYTTYIFPYSVIIKICSKN